MRGKICEQGRERKGSTGTLTNLWNRKREEVEGRGEDKGEKRKVWQSTRRKCETLKRETEIGGKWRGKSG